MSTNAISARALWFESHRRAVLKPDEARVPGPREIRVRALHSLVSAGSEMNMYRGEGNLPSLLLPTIAGSLPFPIKFGYQVVGKVEATGENSGFDVGDLVFCAHPHQDWFTMLGDFATKLPAQIDPLRAAFLGNCTVALRTLLEVPVRVGECVAVSGLGIIGRLVAHLARKTAGRLILIDRLPERRKAAAWIGADAVIDPAEVADVVKQLSDGRGTDVFFETSGAPPALQAAISNSGERGWIVVPAWYGTRPVNLSLSPEFHLRALNIKSVYVMNVGGDEAARWSPARRTSTVLEILNQIDPHALVSQRIPFDRAAEAYRLLDEKPAETLGVILDY